MAKLVFKATPADPSSVPDRYLNLDIHRQNKTLIKEKADLQRKNKRFVYFLTTSIAINLVLIAFITFK